MLLGNDNVLQYYISFNENSKIKLIDNQIEWYNNTYIGELNSSNYRELFFSVKIKYLVIKNYYCNVIKNMYLVMQYWFVYYLFI